MPKLIALAAIVAAVWYGFRWLQRYQQVQKAADKDRVSRQQEPEAPSAGDLVACRKCGTFVAAEGAQSCGRPDCPY